MLTKARRIKLVDHVASVGQKRNYKISVKPIEKIDYLEDLKLNNS